jgi:hypothetical protein
VLRAREHAPTPSPSVVFTFGFAVESIKELGGASLFQNNNNYYILNNSILKHMLTHHLPQL